MSMKLVVDGVEYTNFTSLSCRQSIEQFAGTFSFSAIEVDGNFNEKSYPIKIGSLCRVTIDNVPVLTGYVEVVNVSINEDSHSVTISGREVTCDLIDSTLPGSLEFPGQTISLEAIINKVQKLFNLNLKIINEVPNLLYFEPNEIASPQSGQSAFDFI